MVKLLASAKYCVESYIKWYQGTKSALPGVDPRRWEGSSKQVALIIRAANSVRLFPDVVAVDLARPQLA